MTDIKTTRHKTALSTPRFAGRKARRSVKEVVGDETTREPTAENNKPGRGGRRFRWPVIEVVLTLLLLKIGVGAWMLTTGQKMAGLDPRPAVSRVAGPAAERPEAPLLNEISRIPTKSVASVAAAVDSYLAAAMEAVASPRAALASAPLSSTTSLSIAPIAGGAMSVIFGQSASTPMAQGGEVEPIPLPPGVDLLSPAGEPPPPALPVLGPGIANDQTGDQAQSFRGGGAVPLPPNAAYVSSNANQEALRQREQALAVKEAELASREEALKSLDADIRRQMAAIEDFRNEREAMISRNDAVLAEMRALREEQKKEDEMRKDASLQQLVAAYGAMKPEQAGALVNSLDDDVAVSILSIMPGRKAGMILANVIPEKAARLTKAISERRIDPNLILSDNPAGAGASF